MDIDIFNDILTQTVNKYILGINSDAPRNLSRNEHRDGRMGSIEVNQPGRLSQSSVVSRSNDSRDNSINFDFGGSREASLNNSLSY